MGFTIAKEIGDAHEKDPHVNLSQRVFDDISDADQVVDLLNNIIGRNIGCKYPNEDMKTLAHITLMQFKKEGFFTASKREDGLWFVSRTKITQDQFDTMFEYISMMDSTGRMQ